MPKTATRPTVADAEKQLADALAGEDLALDTLNTLKARILDQGPDAVTAEQLGDAAHRAEHATLAVQHARATLQTAVDAARLATLDDLKASILATAGDPADALAAMQQIEDAATRIITACTGRQQNIARWTRAMHQAGVPETTTPQPEDGHAGLGWSRAGMGRGDAVTVDGRRIAELNAGLILAAALARAARAAGRSPAWLEPALVVTAVTAAVADPEQWLKARY